jgi:hypothetical protein
VNIAHRRTGAGINRAPRSNVSVSPSTRSERSIAVTIDELFSWLDETAAYQAKSRSSSREAKDKPTD